MKEIKLRRGYQFGIFDTGLKLLLGTLMCLGLVFLYFAVSLLVTEGLTQMSVLIILTIIGLVLLVYAYKQYARVFYFTNSSLFIESGTFRKINRTNQLARLFITKRVESETYKIEDVNAVMTIDCRKMSQTLIELCQFDQLYKSEIELPTNGLDWNNVHILPSIWPRRKRKSIITQLKDNVYKQRYERAMFDFMVVVELTSGTVVPMSMLKTKTAADSVTKDLTDQLRTIVVTATVEEQQRKLRKYLEMKKSNHL